MSIPSSLDSILEKQSHTRRASRGKDTKRRRRSIIAGVAGLVVVISLAVGLGVGLTRDRYRARDDLPTAGTNDDEAGLLENGTYYTSYDNDGAQFAWKEISFTRSQGGASSATTNNPIIYMNGSDVGQTMDGFGASLTDSSAQLFSNLKQKNPAIYNDVLDTIFNRRNGINILRVPIGTTDFNPSGLQYTMADVKGVRSDANDTIGPLSHFNMNGANKYIIPFLKDALIRNPELKISLLPWSPPAWMKTSKSVYGGTLDNNASDVFTEYLVKSVQGFQDALGVAPWSLSVQNEPTNPTDYPSMTLDNSVQSSMLASLRGRLAQIGLGSVQLWGHEDNYAGFSDAADLVNSNETSLDGIAWHCYNGSSSLLSNYTNALTVANSSKSMHMSECSGQSDNGQPSSSGLKWWMDNIFSQPAQGISSITVWNLALNQNYGPRSSRAYCKNCVGSIEIDTRGKVTSNVQQLLLSHHATAAADLTRFGGGKASRLGTSVSGDTKNCIRSTLAFSARWSSSNSQRVGLVVQNVCSELVTTTVSVNDEQHFNVEVGHGVTSVVISV